MGNNVWIMLAAALASRRKHNRIAFDLIQIHGWIAKCEELVPWPDARKARFLLACCQPPKEGLHGLVQAKVHFL